MAEFVPFGSDGTNGVMSPGGFEFGVQGWTWGNPIPHSVTFFLDDTAMVCDQYGRPIKGAILSSTGKEVLFAPSPPVASREGVVTPRPWLGSHVAVVEALLEEKIDVITNMNESGMACPRCKGEGRLGAERCRPCKGSGVKVTVQCAGWPQLPYDHLVNLKTLPPSSDEDVLKIRDPKFRRDALKLRRERTAEYERTQKELQEIVDD